MIEHITVMKISPKKIVLPLVLIGALMIRAAVALFTDHIYHPDELFQALEQAHRWVFGNGIIPWEFRFGTRSWLLPGLVSVPLWVSKLLHLGRPDIYIPLTKLYLSAISLVVPWGIYSYTKTIASHRAAIIALLLTSTWYELIYVAHRSLSECLGMAVLIAALGLRAYQGPKSQVFQGLFLGLSLVFRIQLFPVVILILAMDYWQDRQRLSRMLGIGLGTAVLLSGALDHLTWGTWWASTINNIGFNLGHQVAAIFGTHRPLSYLTWIMIGSLGLFSVSIFAGMQQFRQAKLPFLVMMTILLSHSLIGHKEYRFMIPMIPFMLLLISVQIDRFLETRDQDLYAGLWSKCLIAWLVLANLLGLLSQIPGQGQIYKWPLLWTDPSLTIYRELSNDPSLNALVDLSDPWHMTGGFYYLHHQKPLILNNHLGIHPDWDIHQIADYLLVRKQVQFTAQFSTVATTRFKKLGRREHPSESVMPSNYGYEIFQPKIDDRFSSKKIKSSPE